MKNKAFRLFWVVLLVISSFILGYSLKPKSSQGTLPPFMKSQAMGRFNMPQGRMAPPLNFPRR